MQIRHEIEAWPRTRSFAIAGRTFHDARVLTVSIEADGLTGRAEASGVYYRGETVETMAREVEALDLGGLALTRSSLASRLPPGGARDLAADRSPAASYAEGLVSCPDALWGHPQDRGDAGA